jgi:hypothetical protein
VAFALACASRFSTARTAGANEVDIPHWTLTQHPTRLPIFSSVKVPAGTKLAAKNFYLLGLPNCAQRGPRWFGRAGRSGRQLAPWH